MVMIDVTKMAVLWGKIHKSGEMSVEWSIPIFLSLPSVVGKFYYSPEFSVLDSSWSLEIYPNGDWDNETPGYIDILLTRCGELVPDAVNFTIGMKRTDGGETVLHEAENVAFAGEYDSALATCMSRSEFKKRQFEFITSGTLTVICTFKPTLVEGKDLLVQNVKDLFLNGYFSDVIINVRDGEFKVHKAILGARSPVFARMFQLDTTEKSSGVVDVTDCSKDAFKAFLLYLYSGEDVNWHSDLLFDLYYIADKYGVSDLKKKCTEHLRDLLRVDTFCDIALLSLRHCESELLTDAIRFFCQNMGLVTKTVQWKRLVKENPKQVDELRDKATDFQKAEKGRIAERISYSRSRFPGVPFDELNEPWALPLPLFQRQHESRRVKRRSRKPKFPIYKKRV